MTTKVNIQGAALHLLHLSAYPGRPTIVFLHDSLGCVALWRNFPEALGRATTCNILVYDRQGYGKSSPFGNTARNNSYLETEAGVLNALLAQCGVEDAILFGHSDGGTIALIAAAKYPKRIRSIITEGAHIFVEDITLAGIKAAVEAYHSTNLKQRLQKYHGEKTDAVFNAWASTWLTGGLRSWNIEHFLPQITCPVLVIQGEDDEYGSLRQVAGIVHQVSGPAKQCIIPGTGHSPHKQATEIVMQKASDFINSIVG